MIHIKPNTLMALLKHMHCKLVPNSNWSLPRAGNLLFRRIDMPAFAGLFRWLVDRINTALSVGKQKTETSLSILDIYGFECCKENSFEQL